MMDIVKISDLPEEDRPFEKFMRGGAGCLSDSELLALILRTGTRKMDVLELSRQVLKKCNGITGLMDMCPSDFRSVEGIGMIKASQLICVGELSKRIAKTRKPLRAPLHNASLIADRYMEEMRHLKEEHVKLLMLDSKCCLIREVELGKGSVNRSVLSPREVMVNAVKYEAVNLVLLHNHPSGDPKPSDEDLAVTERVRRSGELIGIPLVDHIIIGDCCYTSFQEEGMITD